MSMTLYILYVVMGLVTAFTIMVQMEYEYPELNTTAHDYFITVFFASIWPVSWVIVLVFIFLSRTEVLAKKVASILRKKYKNS